MEVTSKVNNEFVTIYGVVDKSNAPPNDKVVTIGGVASTHTPPNFIVFSPIPGVELLRLDKTGMTYKGQLIEDGGEAHRAFLEALGIMRNGHTQKG